jgi:hypothetical protein
MRVVQCFLMTPLDKTEQRLRRYRTRATAEGVCSVNGYHTVSVVVAVKDLTGLSAEERDAVETSSKDYWPHEDPRWPKLCACGYEFTGEDEWQYFPHRMYSCSDGGPDCTIRDARPGALWDAEWNHDIKEWCGPDGKSYMCRLPNGRDWMIDGRASNCTMPADKIHKCWCRHGEAPMLTVNKIGNTCQAGQGSIQSEGYHGFLTNGQLVD